MDWRTDWEKWALVLILMLAAGLRFYHLDFGKPFAYHPDEIKLTAQAGRLLATKFMDKAAYFGITVYPPFFTYMLSIVLGIYIGFSLLTGRFASLAAVQAAYQAEPFQYLFVGRVLSAVLGVGVVLLTFLIGRRIFSKRIGLLAALLAAVNMALVNHAHFSTVDTAATFWGLLSFYYCVRIYESGYWRHYLLAAAFAALATATKFNLALTVLPLLAAHLLRLSRPGWFKQLFGAKLPAAAAAGIIAFLIACPLIWLDFHETLGGIIGTGRFEKIGKIGSGGELLSYWTGRQAPGFGVFYPNNLPESFGVLLTLVCAISLPALFRLPKKSYVLLLLGILPSYLLFEHMAVKAIRHLLPIIPLMLIAAAALLYSIGSWKKNVGRAAAVLVIAIIAGENIGHTLGYWKSLSQPDPRTLAREWITANISKGALLVVEDFPPPLPDLRDTPEGYRILSIGISERKEGIADSLNKLLKSEPLLYYIGDGFSRQVFAWKETLKRYPSTAWDRVQFFDWLDRTGKLVGRFDSRHPHLQPDIFIYELKGKRR